MVSPYFAPGASINQTNTSNTGSTIQSGISRASVKMAPARRIPKTRLRNPTVFGTTWIDNSGRMTAKPSKSEQKQKSQILDDILQRRSSVNLVEATKRCRRIVEKVRASVKTSTKTSDSMSTASSPIPSDIRSFPNEMAVSSPTENKTQRNESLTSGSAIRSVPNEMVVSTPSQNKTQNNDNSTDISAIRSVPNEVAVSTSNDNKTQKSHNDTFSSAIRSLPNEMAMSTLNNVNTVDIDENATMDDVIVIPPPDDFV